jgi:hypothetical protein
MSEIRCGSARFVDIPEYFLLRYASEINGWAENLRKVGLVKSIFLREGCLADLSPDAELGAVMLVVRLKCRPWGETSWGPGGVEVSPFGEADRELIAAHCRKLEGAKVPPEAVLREPERPWVPFMPKIDLQ